jgi:26S proteasome non-ATPase regulatory subunit 10
VDIHQAAHDGDIQAVKQYLNASGDVNAKGEDGRTPLHGAVIGRQKEVVELLLAEGADVNAKNRVELTPLHYAGDQINVCEFLLSKDAQVNAVNNAGETPLDNAIFWKDSATTALLRKHGGKTGEELKAEGAK